MDPRIKETIESYDSTVEDYTKKVDKLLPSSDAEDFMSYLDVGDSVLDLGCGPGRDARFFTEKGFDVTGIDLSEKMVKKAKQRVPAAHFSVMDILDLDFSDQKFDSVWASAVFLHIPKKELKKAFQETDRVLKKGGIFYLSVKKGEGEEFTPDERYGGVNKFWAFYSEEEIAGLLIETGFEIIRKRIDTEKNSYKTHPWIKVICKKP